MKRGTGFLLSGLLVALFLAAVVSDFASGSPDGLDSASVKGCTTDPAGEITGGTCMGAAAEEHEVGGPLADYGLAGVENAFLGTAAAGVLGVLLTFALAGGLFWAARSRRPVSTG